MPYKYNFNEFKKGAINRDLNETLNPVLFYEIDKSPKNTGNILHKEYVRFFPSIHIDENGLFDFKGIYINNESYDEVPDKFNQQLIKQNINNKNYGMEKTYNSLLITKNENEYYAKPITKIVVDDIRNNNENLNNFKIKNKNNQSLINIYQDIFFLMDEYSDTLKELYEKSTQKNNLKAFEDFYKSLIEHYNFSIINHKEELELFNNNPEYGSHRFEVCFDEEFRSKVNTELKTIELLLAVDDLKNKNETRDITTSRFEILEDNLKELKDLEKNIRDKYIFFDDAVKEYAGKSAYRMGKFKIETLLNDTVISDEELKQVKNFERKKMASGLTSFEEKEFIKLNNDINKKVDEHIMALDKFIKFENDLKLSNGVITEFVKRKQKGVQNVIGLQAVGEAERILELNEYKINNNILHDINKIKENNQKFINYHYTKSNVTASEIMKSEQNFDKIFKEHRDKRDVFQQNIIERLSLLETLNPYDAKNIDFELDKMIRSNQDFSRFLFGVNNHSGSIKALRFLDPANKQLIESVLGSNYETLTKDEVFEKLMYFNETYFEKATGKLFSTDVFKQSLYSINEDYQNLLIQIDKIESNENAFKNYLSTSDIENIKELEIIKEDNFKELKNYLKTLSSNLIEELKENEIGEPIDKNKLNNVIIQTFDNNGISDDKNFNYILELFKKENNDLYNVFKYIKEHQNKDISYEGLYFSMVKAQITPKEKNFEDNFNNFIRKRNLETSKIITKLENEKVIIDGIEMSKLETMGFIKKERFLYESDYNKALDDYDKYQKIYNFFELTEFNQETKDKFNYFFKDNEFLKHLETKEPMKSLGIMLELRNSLKRDLNKNNLNERTIEDLQKKLYFLEKDVLSISNMETSPFIENPIDYKIFMLLNEHEEKISLYKKEIKEEYDLIINKISTIDKQINLLDENKFLDDNNVIKKYKTILSESEKNEIVNDLLEEKKQLNEKLSSITIEKIKEINKPLKDALENKYIKDLNKTKKEVITQFDSIFNNLNEMNITLKEKAIFSSVFLYQNGISDARRIFKSLLDENYDLSSFDMEKQERINNSLFVENNDVFLYELIRQNFSHFNSEELKNIYNNLEKFLDIYENSENNIEYSEFTKYLKQYLNKNYDIIISDHRIESLNLNEEKAIETININGLIISKENLSLNGVKALFESFNSDNDITKLNAFSNFICGKNDINNCTIEDLENLKNKLKIIGSDITKDDINVDVSENYVEKYKKYLMINGNKDKVLMLNLFNESIFLDDLSAKEDINETLKNSILNNIKNHSNESVIKIENLIDKIDEILKDNNLNHESKKENKEQEISTYRPKMSFNQEYNLENIQKFSKSDFESFNYEDLKVIMFKLIEKNTNFEELLNEEQLNMFREKIYELNDKSKEKEINILKNLINNNCTNLSHDFEINKLEENLNKIKTNLNEIEYKQDTIDILRNKISNYLINNDIQNIDNRTHEDFINSNKVLENEYKSKQFFNYLLSDEILKDINKNLASKSKDILDFIDILDSEKELNKNKEIKKILNDITENYEKNLYQKYESNQKVSLFNSIKNHWFKNNENKMESDNFDKFIYNAITNKFEKDFELKDFTNENIEEYFKNLSDTEKIYLSTYLEEKEKTMEITDELKDEIITTIKEKEDYIDLDF